MPRDYQKANPVEYQRRPELIRGDEWVREFLRHAKIAHIAHLSGDQPFITPTNFWFDEQYNQIIFHSNISGRVRSNVENNPNVCVEVSEYGHLLPANTALEFSIQFRSVMAYGRVKILVDAGERRRVLYGLISKYFPNMTAGKEYRPITDKELANTSVYAIRIEAWSGKENWMKMADQLPDWPPLAKEFFQ